MAKLNCPVPDCPAVALGRQTHVNKHLRTAHQVPLEQGTGGNIPLLRETQQKQFSSWLSKNGYANLNLFSGSTTKTPEQGVQDDDLDNDDEIDIALIAQKPSAPVAGRKRPSHPNQPASNGRSALKSTSASTIPAQTTVSKTTLKEQVHARAGSDDNDEAEPDMSSATKKRRTDGGHEDSGDHEIPESILEVAQDRPDAFLVAETLGASHEHPMVQQALWTDRNLMHSRDMLQSLKFVAERDPHLADFRVFKAMVEEELYKSISIAGNAFAAQNAEMGIAANNLEAMEQRIRDLHEQMTPLEHRYEQRTEQSQAALVTLDQLREQIKALESRWMKLDAQISASQTSIQAPTPRESIGSQQAIPHQHAAPRSTIQTQAEGQPAAGEVERQTTMPGTDMPEPMPTEKVSRAQVKQPRELQTQVPAIVNLSELPPEERVRQMNDELNSDEPKESFFDYAMRVVGSLAYRPRISPDSALNQPWDVEQQWESPSMFERYGEEPMFDDPVIFD